MKRYDALIEQCDIDIREGRPKAVARRLTQLDPTRVPREWKAPLAKVCRRAGLYSLGLLLLNRLVHPNKELAAAVTDGELAEYAVLLLRSGAVREAQAYLRQIDTNTTPDALLYQAFAHFTRWEFNEAILHLDNYLKAPLSPYAQLVAKTNLAYAHVESKNHEEALKLLAETIAAAHAGGHHVLEYNCRAYKAQAHVQQQDLPAAKAELARFDKQDDHAPTNDLLVVNKWKLIIEGLERKSRDPFERLRAFATLNRDWASCREADFYSLKVDFSKERLLHLYFGTPYKGFRDCIAAEIGAYPDRHTYVLGAKDSPRMDLMTGEVDGLPGVQPGGMCHQMIEALLRDFYQPLRIAALFSELFPKEHFIASSSPDRVHQLIRRTRRWLKESRIPVLINESHGFYSLQIVGPFSFRVPLDRRPMDRMSLQFEKLEKLYAHGRPFSAKNAREQLQVSKSTFFRLLHWGLENQKVERLDGGKGNAQYRIAS